MTNTSTASFVATLGVAGASAVAATGLMLMLVALGAMSVTWMLVLAAVITAQKVLPPRARRRLCGAGDRCRRNFAATALRASAAAARPPRRARVGAASLPASTP